MFSPTQPSALDPPGAAPRPLRVLIIEDSEADAHLLLRELKLAGYSPTHRRVVCAAMLEEALREGAWDLVLSDYALPQFDGLEALQVVRSSGLDLPFLLISGTIGEDVAVAAMKAGAHDYLLKDRLARLGAAVERELREAQERLARRQAEAETRRLLKAAEQSRLALLSVVEDLREAQERTHLQATALNAAANAIAITDRQGDILWSNPAFSALTGYEAEEVRGQNPRLLKGGQHPESFYSEIWQTILAGRVWHGEMVNRHKQGHLYSEECTITPVRGADGAITHFIAVKQDITERKRLESQFLRAQRLEAIGALASGIAHDLNNILAPILMTVPLLRGALQDEENVAMLESVESCARRGADIIRQLLTFARGVPGARVALPIRHFLRDMEKLIRETFPRDIKPRVLSPDDLWSLGGDATQVHQALLNLCVNARDAMPDGGTLTLTARNAVVDEAFAARTPGARVGAYVCIGVSDTGTGIAPEHLSRIFDPFFTTKEPGKGTGLGLATVLGIVRGHDGFVRVDSHPGQGTSFELFFPSSRPVEEPHPPTVEPLPPCARGELVLVVDDEATIRQVIRATLLNHGYQVLSAAQGGEAISLLTERRGQVRAVLADMMMPVMSGPALVKALRAIDPGLVILGMTGLQDRSAVKGMESMALCRLLAKPFSGEELLRALHAALARPTGACVQEEPR